MAAKKEKVVKKKAAAKKTTAVEKKRATKKKKKRKPNPQFMKPVRPDAQLAAVVGSEPLPRRLLTKKIWNYIKRHELQDKQNRRMINADAKLKPVFDGKSKVSMFEMEKYLGHHLRKAPSAVAIFGRTYGPLG